MWTKTNCAITRPKMTLDSTYRHSSIRKYASNHALIVERFECKWFRIYQFAEVNRSLLCLCSGSDNSFNELLLLVRHSIISRTDSTTTNTHWLRCCGFAFGIICQIEAWTNCSSWIYQVNIAFCVRVKMKLLIFILAVCVVCIEMAAVKRRDLSEIKKNSWKTLPAFVQPVERLRIIDRMGRSNHTNSTNDPEETATNKTVEQLLADIFNDWAANFWSPMYIFVFDQFENILDLSARMTNESFISRFPEE